MDINKCYNHEKDIKEIQTEFGTFKKDVSIKLEEIMIQLSKPLLSDRQIFSMIIGVVAYLIIAVTYVNKTDARSIENFNNIEKSVEKDKQIMELLIDIKTIVDRNEGSKQNN